MIQQNVRHEPPLPESQLKKLKMPRDESTKRLAFGDPCVRLRNAALRRGRNARQEEPVTPCFGPRLRFSRVDSADILSGPA